MSVPLHEHSLYVKLLLQATPEIEEQRPTLVFLHEALGSVAQWKAFPLELCEKSGCDGMVYDRVGHGQSSPMQRARDIGFYTEEAEDILPELFRQLNIRRPLLIGHSDGATIALKFASSHPHFPVAVISIAAHVIIEDTTLQGIREARIKYDTSDLRVRLARYHGDKTDAVFSAWADTWLQPGIQHWNMTDDLKRIQCPLLIVQGEHDAYGSRQQVDMIARHAQGENSVLWLPHCGHVPHLEARQRLLEAAASFIEASL